ncbi:chemotaxis protein CheW [Tolumonas lignilytica]|uniref:chemotaxis protein CheW n=1 Tax=Tolumonas lignilytica TaxID=1283284 RepID=UPI00046596E4|nr:chemotaxis protein CheW [Tolumonas lignilytica]
MYQEKEFLLESAVTPLFVFRLDNHLYALPLADVERVTRSAAITPVAQSSPVLQGVVNVQGELLPVVNTRRLLSLPERDLDIDDIFILTRNNEQRVILIADAVHQVIQANSADILVASSLLGRHSPWQGLLALEDGMVMIQDLPSCLRYFEQQPQADLTLAMDGAQHG